MSRKPVSIALSLLAALGAAMANRCGATSSMHALAAGDGYVPVAPLESLVRSIRLNLKVAGDWLNEGDFESAADTIERTKLLIDFCDLRSSEESWQRRIGELRSQCQQLVDESKKKDADASSTRLKEIAKTLDAVASTPPPVDARSVAEYEPKVPVRSFMKLLDSCYADAKSAKSIADLQAMVYAIAETTNAAQFLRTDDIWRERAGDVRQAALRVAALKPDTDLKVARAELKNVYERCQACHKTFRK
jgi:hypothetical protein